jgi:signal transduction histidine kinase
MSSFSFVFRLLVAWILGLVVVMLFWKGLFGRAHGLFFFLSAIALIWMIVTAISHVNRVRLIAGRADAASLANRHRRQIEVPFPAEQAFALVDAAIRELPGVEGVESARDSLRVFARVPRPDPYPGGKTAKPKKSVLERLGIAPGNQVLATVAPREGTATVTLICEPERLGWLDWFLVDHGTNLENAEAVARAITRRVTEQRKGEEATVQETAAQKELAVAKLGLLHAQVEPHFLYNTLASAQLLVRSDPAKADEMLGNLIAYLRNSLPRAEESISTLGEELERVRAYLDILRIRMGERLKLQLQVPDALKGVPMPPMMLQTLVENAIKHGLEPEPGGGTVWIIARAVDGKVAVTVADDGRGFSTEGGGTAIGLKNVRERLRLAYGDAASFAIVANYPKGVAATITVPGHA